MAVDGPATRPSKKATRHRATLSRKLLSRVVGCEAERQADKTRRLNALWPKRLHTGQRSRSSSSYDVAASNRTMMKSAFLHAGSPLLRFLVAFRLGQIVFRNRARPVPGGALTLGLSL